MRLGFAIVIIPTRPRLIRGLFLIHGVITLLWLSREDNSAGSVVTLGCGLALLLLIHILMSRLGGRRITTPYDLLGGAVLGLLLGVGTAVTTSGLMVFKNALHAHIFLDYPPPVILGVLQRAPVWTLAGGLGGLGLALAWRVVRHKQPLESADGGDFA